MQVRSNEEGTDEAVGAEVYVDDLLIHSMNRQAIIAVTNGLNETAMREADQLEVERLQQLDVFNDVENEAEGIPRSMYNIETIEASQSMYHIDTADDESSTSSDESDGYAFSDEERDFQ